MSGSKCNCHCAVSLSCREMINTFDSDLDRVRRRLRSVDESRDNRLKLFGTWVPQALTEIDRERHRFYHRPIGPLGELLNECCMFQLSMLPTVGALVICTGVICLSVCLSVCSYVCMLAIYCVRICVCMHMFECERVYTYVCVGSLVSVLDQKWAPAVEKVLRRDFFSSFLCHNHRDRETLNHILKRVVGSCEDLPPLIVTPFRDRAYNYQDYVCHSLAATFSLYLEAPGLLLCPMCFTL